MLSEAEGIPIVGSEGLVRLTPLPPPLKTFAEVPVWTFCDWPKLLV